MPNLFGDIPTHLESVRGAKKKKKKSPYVEVAHAVFPRLTGGTDFSKGPVDPGGGGGLLSKALMKLLG